MTEQNGPMVLVVNDIPSVIRLLQLELGMQGFRVRGAQVGEGTFAAIEEERPDVILLEVLLPGINGLDMMQALSERYDIPVVFLTTEHGDADRALAYELGAADYVTKPFDPYELGQRLTALVKGGPPQERKIEVGDLRIDLTRQVARRTSGVISLSINEWALLMALALRPNELIATPDLLTDVWGDNGPELPQRLMPIITRLRRSLEEDPERPQLLTGDMETGFRLNVEERREAK